MTNIQPKGTVDRTGLKILRAKVLGKIHKFLDRRFDRIHRIETSKNENLTDLEIAGSVAGYEIDELYAGTPHLLFGALHTVLPRRKRDEVTYVDVGAGKGRMLIQAGQAGFTKLHGIEFVASLAEQGRKNVQSVLGKGEEVDWEIKECDARECQYPEGDLLIFLYNPFDPPVFEGFLSNLVDQCRDNPREVTLIYKNCICADLLDGSPNFTNVTHRLAARAVLSALNPHRFAVWRFVEAGA